MGPSTQASAAASPATCSSPAETGVSGRRTKSSIESGHRLVLKCLLDGIGALGPESIIASSSGIAALPAQRHKRVDGSNVITQHKSTARRGQPRERQAPSIPSACAAAMPQPQQGFPRERQMRPFRDPTERLLSQVNTDAGRRKETSGKRNGTVQEVPARRVGVGPASRGNAGFRSWLRT